MKNKIRVVHVQSNVGQVPPKIECNNIEHMREQITHICLRADCNEQRAHCRKCNLTQHRQCGGEIKFLDEITDQISRIDRPGMEISNIIEQVIQKLKSVQNTYNSIIQKIKQYSGAPNLIDLNTVAGILNNFSPQQIRKLIQGQELLDNLIKSHFMPNITQNIGNRQTSPTNVEINPKPNTQAENIPILNPNSLINCDLSSINNSTCPISNIISNPRFVANFKPSSNNNNTNSNFNINDDPSFLTKQSNTNPIPKIQDNPAPPTNIGQNSNPDTYNTPTPQTIINAENNDSNISNYNQNNNSTLIDKDAAQQYHMKGQFYYTKQQYMEAIEHFDVALGLDRNRPTTWNNRGTALNRLDRDAESIECFDKALEIINSKPQIDRESKIAYITNKASALIRLRQFEHAIKTVDEGLALDPQNKTFFKFKVASLMRSDQFTQALKVVDEALELDPKNYKAHQFKGQVLHKLKKTEEAIQSLIASYSILPKKKTYLILGQLLKKLCRFDEAEQCFKKALDLDKNYEAAKQELETVQQYQQIK